MEDLKSAIIIVNWNCWQDTCRCIAACLNMSGFNGDIYVCDNHSGDGSLDHIQSWLRGLQEVESDAPFPYLQVCLDSLQTNLYGVKVFCGSADDLSTQNRGATASDRFIFLIRHHRNDGYATANNIAVRLAEKVRPCDWYWFLNPDAVPAVDAYQKIAESDFFFSEDPVLSGTALIEYWQPDTIQALGGYISKFMPLSFPLAAGLPLAKLPKTQKYSRAGCPIGASMLLNSWYLAQHGYMDERYFLYSEEPDLALRLKKPFKIRIIVDALVFHKGGASTGSARPLRQRSLGSEYYSLRSRMLLARKMGLPMFGLSICFAFFQVARRMFSSPAHFFNSAIAIIDGIRNKGGRRF